MTRDRQPGSPRSAVSGTLFTAVAAGAGRPARGRTAPAASAGYRV